MKRLWLEDIMELRNNPDAYFVFFNPFLPCITGKTAWNERMKTAKKDSDMAEDTDEAFALLLIENSYYRWEDLFDKEYHSQEDGKEEEKIESDVDTLYTSSNQKYKDRAIKNGERGWSKQGIVRFNELVDSVRKDRKKNNHFFQKWREYLRMGKKGNEE